MKDSPLRRAFVLAALLISGAAHAAQVKVLALTPLITKKDKKLVRLRMAEPGEIFQVIKLPAENAKWVGVAVDLKTQAWLAREDVQLSQDDSFQGENGPVYRAQQSTMGATLLSSWNSNYGLGLAVGFNIYLPLAKTQRLEIWADLTSFMVNFSKPFWASLALRYGFFIGPFELAPELYASFAKLLSLPAGATLSRSKAGAGAGLAMNLGLTERLSANMSVRGNFADKSGINIRMGAGLDF